MVKSFPLVSKYGLKGKPRAMRTFVSIWRHSTRARTVRKELIAEDISGSTPALGSSPEPNTGTERLYVTDKGFTKGLSSIFRLLVRVDGCRTEANDNVK